MFMTALLSRRAIALTVFARGETKVSRHSRIRAAAVLVVLSMLSAGCGSAADGDGGTIVQPESATAPESPPTDSGSETTENAGSSSSELEEPAPDSNGTQNDVGTRSNPAPLGATARIDDWEVTVTEVNKDAADLVAAENMFNEPPADGRSFVMWTVEAEYVGDESGTAWIDLSWKLVGSEGNSFSAGSGDGCGVLPDDLDDAGETFPGGTVSGNVCVSVEAAQIEGGTILVEGFFGESRTFFAIP